MLVNLRVLTNSFEDMMMDLSCGYIPDSIEDIRNDSKYSYYLLIKADILEIMKTALEYGKQDLTKKDLNLADYGYWIISPNVLSPYMNVTQMIISGVDSSVIMDDLVNELERSNCSLKDCLDEKAPVFIRARRLNKIIRGTDCTTNWKPSWSIAVWITKR